MVIHQLFSSTLLGVECYAVQPGLLGKTLLTTRYSQLRSAIKLFSRERSRVQWLSVITAEGIRMLRQDFGVSAQSNAQQQLSVLGTRTAE